MRYLRLFPHEGFFPFSPNSPVWRACLPALGSFMSPLFIVFCQCARLCVFTIMHLALPPPLTHSDLFGNLFVLLWEKNVRKEKRRVSEPGKWCLWLQRGQENANKLQTFPFSPSKVLLLCDLPENFWESEQFKKLQLQGKFLWYLNMQQHHEKTLKSSTSSWWPPQS